MTTPTTCYVIFGAAVRRDGTPSPTLRRRVEGALAAGAGDSGALFIPTGASGRHGFGEAGVMARILRDGGVAADRIIEDNAASDTFDSVVNTARIVRGLGRETRVVVCTNRYHAPRCRLLFLLAGLGADACPMGPDLPRLGPRRWLYHAAREVPAIGWDAFLMLLRRLRAAGAEPT